MILIRGLYRGVGSETFALFVIVVIDFFAGPILLALNAEMVIRRTGEKTVAAVGFEDSLRQSDAGRDSITLHVIDGNRVVAVDILFACLSRWLLRNGRMTDKKRKKERNDCFLGNIHYIC